MYTKLAEEDKIVNALKVILKVSKKKVLLQSENYS